MVFSRAIDFATTFVTLSGAHTLAIREARACLGVPHAGLDGVQRNRIRGGVTFQSESHMTWFGRITDVQCLC